MMRRSILAFSALVIAACDGNSADVIYTNGRIKL